MSGRRWPVIALLTPVAFMLMAASSCDVQQSTVNQPNSPGGGSTGSSSAPASQAAAQVAHVGDTLSLTGNTDGEKLDVTVVKIVDPAPPKDDYNQPSAGTRFVSLELRFKNTGTVTYKDSVLMGASLADAGGHSYNPSLSDSAAGPPIPNAQINVAPGETADGFITFEVPTGQKPAGFKFTMDSGFASDTGAWQIP